MAKNYYHQSKETGNFETAETLRIKQQACLMTDDSLRATREMLRLITTSQDAGAATLAELHRQGDAFDRTEGAFDEIHVGLQNTENDLIKMERVEKHSCCGLCFKNFCICCSRKKETHPDIWLKKKKNPSPIIDHRIPKSTIGNNGDFITRITNDSREDEMEANMRGVAEAVGSIKNLVIDMGTTISKHNSQLDVINKKVDKINNNTNTNTTCVIYTIM